MRALPQCHALQEGHKRLFVEASFKIFKRVFMLESEQQAGPHTDHLTQFHFYSSIRHRAQPAPATALALVCLEKL